jgi:HEAT repeat protein
MNRRKSILCLLLNLACAAAGAEQSASRLTPADIPATTPELRYLISALLTGAEPPPNLSKALERPGSMPMLSADPGVPLKASAARALGARGPSAAVALPFLMQELHALVEVFLKEGRSVNAPRTSLQEEAASAIGKIGGFEALEQALAQARGHYRNYIYTAIAETGDSRASDLLLDLIDKEPLTIGGTGAAAAIALGRLREPRAVAPLLKHLREGGLLSRDVAMRVLGEIGDPRAIEPLIEHISKTRLPGPRETAGQALAKLTGQSFGRDKKAWKDWWEREGRARSTMSPGPAVGLSVPTDATETTATTTRHQVSITTGAGTISAVVLTNTRARTYNDPNRPPMTPNQCDLAPTDAGVLWKVLLEGVAIPAKEATLVDEHGQAFQQLCWSSSGAVYALDAAGKSTGGGPRTEFLAAGPHSPRQLTLKVGETPTTIVLSKTPDVSGIK